MITLKDKMTTEPNCTQYSDLVFDSEMNKIIPSVDKHYSRMSYRDVINEAFFGMMTARDEYRKYHQNVATMNWHLINKFIRSVIVMLSPIASHFCEHAWRNILKEPSSIFSCLFPTFLPHNPVLLKSNEYIKKFSRQDSSCDSKVKKETHKYGYHCDFRVSPFPSKNYQYRQKLLRNI